MGLSTQVSTLLLGVEEPQAVPIFSGTDSTALVGLVKLSKFIMHWHDWVNAEEVVLVYSPSSPQACLDSCVVVPTEGSTFTLFGVDTSSLRLQFDSNRVSGQQAHDKLRAKGHHSASQLAVL